MSRYHIYLTYAVSFAVIGAKQPTGSEANMLIVTRPQRVPRTITCKTKTELCSLPSSSNGKEEEASTESRKTSKLIAYISIKPCKSYQYKCAMLCQGQISMEENASVHRF